MNQQIILGAGCFWCIEAIYKEVNGVLSVESGYTGGHHSNPTYKEVCSGTTGHAEVARITYDGNLISLSQLLEIFWRAHDPTTLNRQGNDVGTQYRSVIFYSDDEQEHMVRASLKAAQEAQLWENPIVTEISPSSEFFIAEEIHHDYYENNPDQPYCTYVVGPKVQKFKHLFAEYLKSS